MLNRVQHCTAQWHWYLLLFWALNNSEMVISNAQSIANFVTRHQCQAIQTRCQCSNSVLCALQNQQQATYQATIQHTVSDTSYSSKGVIHGDDDANL